MQSSSSLECTLNWKHSFSSTCRHPPSSRSSVSVSVTTQRRTEAVAACSSSLYTDSVNTASQLKSLYQELTRLAIVDLILAAFSSLRSNGRCRLICTCATCYWLNRRVLGNIEATNATRSHIHRFPRRGTLSRSMWGSLRLAPIKVTGYRRWAWLMLKLSSCLSLRVSIVQNLQSYAFSSLYGQLYLQESARLNFTHTLERNS